MAQLIAAYFITLLVLVAAQSPPEFVKGEPEASSRAVQSRAEDGAGAAANEAKCETGKAGGLCADCFKLLMCDGKSEDPLVEIVCAEGAPESPYCVDNKCAAEPGDDASCKKASDISCTFEGYMPDPKNCSKYYYCPGAGEDAAPYNCPQNYVYDHKTTMCKLKNTEADCATLQCAPGKMFVTYTPDPSVYAYCDPKTNKTTVFRCEDDVNEWFIEKTLSCGLICKKQGPFADRKDCKKYHMCFVVNGKWNMKHEDCPSGLHFDPENLKCVKGEECTPEITTEASSGGAGGAGGEEAAGGA